MGYRTYRGDGHPHRRDTVKSYSALRVARLPVPRVRSGCAVLDARAAATVPDMVLPR